MVEELPILEEPQWLSCVDPATIQDDEFPLDDILQDSLYYPASGFDGDPVRHLGGNILSFVYVDYYFRKKALDKKLNESGFRGYEVIATRNVAKSELDPRGLNPSFFDPRGWLDSDGDISQYRDVMQDFFCSWIILQRLKEVPASHGPRRFSLLHLCADGVAAFQALFIANRKCPRCVAVIQPGTGFGFNRTDFRDPQKIFARNIFQNLAGRPKFLLYGGDGGGYRESCWPDEYPELICSLPKSRSWDAESSVLSGSGSIRLWRAAQQ